MRKIDVPTQPEPEIINWSSTLSQLEQVAESMRPLTSLNIHSRLIETISSVMDGLNYSTNGYLKTLSDIQDSIKPLELNVFSQLTSSLLEVQGEQRHLWKSMSPTLLLINQTQELLNSYKELHLTNLVEITSSLSSIFADNNIRDIDLSGFEDLEVDFSSGGAGTLSPSIQVADLQDSGTVTTGQKKLIDMTEEDLTKLVTKAITTAGAFSLPVFIYHLYAEYVNDAARVIIEIIFAFSLTFVMGQYNAEVKAVIADTIQDSMVVKDTRKVITKYIKINPVDQVAFLRKETHLRQGTSKTSPVVPGGKVSTKSVLTILERKNNWIKVEVDTDESCGEIGWVEESKVVKFKKIK
ncbi:hypothetical protein [Cytobacillus oceanisediminis]|uniref:SH3 domain-containing protein n=1 Tax=Cytobacillus oceanisediminis TaxID=665099 RepID=A0ABX3CMW9_9BACI|nr:hypothetical protein [Cytobacillus oceanisediminis]OHX44757.1 hypothetical protein BBV17_24960 [Cytobacillus oceanisediminis]